MSWTWCIGMFLPVLLIRDYGFWAWVVFAVPNVVGAAAMGWVISAEDAASIRLNHEPAVLGFSAVTAAFQLFFIAWISVLLEDGARAFLPCAAVAVLSFGVAILRPQWMRAMAGLVFFCSAICALFMRQNGMLTNYRVVIEQFSSKLSPQLAGLTAVCVLGFLLCPYLDATFLRVRRYTNPSEARAAFSFGFGVCFGIMIVITLFYAQRVAYLIAVTALPVVFPAVVIHWIIQLAFTINVHVSEMLRIENTRNSRRAFAGLVGLGVVAVVSLLEFSNRTASGELIYRLFLSFYGLIFPAYVWLCMIPTRGRTKPSAHSLRVFAIACLVASPMYWLGFIEKKMLWLIPGVAVVLLARVLVPKNPDVNVRLAEPSIQA
jgi:hypothetical protein